MNTDNNLPALGPVFLWLTHYRQVRISEDETTTVLVVEDELLVRRELVEALHNAGYRTYEAQNAIDGITILEAHPEIRVVFTDVEMPGDMDVLHLSHNVRYRWPPTQIVVCSAEPLASLDMLPARSSFMAKPYTPEAIERVLSHVAKHLPVRGS